MLYFGIIADKTRKYSLNIYNSLLYVLLQVVDEFPHRSGSSLGEYLLLGSSHESWVSSPQLQVDLAPTYPIEITRVK